MDWDSTPFRLFRIDEIFDWTPLTSQHTHDLKIPVVLWRMSAEPLRLHRAAEGGYQLSIWYIQIRLECGLEEWRVIEDHYERGIVTCHACYLHRLRLRGYDYFAIERVSIMMGDMEVTVETLCPVLHFRDYEWGKPGGGVVLRALGYFKIRERGVLTWWKEEDFLERVRGYRGDYVLRVQPRKTIDWGRVVVEAVASISGRREIYSTDIGYQAPGDNASSWDRDRFALASGFG
ncbi:hypothetical protein DFP72DRAFT_858686 [Ephemerocybe angulata]|uniref:Uncharacterized protein n=1 Tax=Ephemerocybe angulata TaxID=980116 RepID=A0A8H6HAR9_9AGAR|nr:hypothetical protein DFP72DRAFT_858686 [Tulosesus angulatus]